jgi:DNA-binding LacI/PurR family transcriptional regulator
VKHALRLVDVAKAAGVSRSTASNVFTRPERVRPELRERVEAAARKLGYAGPDPKGRLLRAGNFNAIGVIPFAEIGIADALRAPFFRMFMEGVAEVCDELGTSLVLISGADDAKGGGIKEALVDGLILTLPEELALIEPAKLRRLPFVVVDAEVGPDINSVRIDARAGCRAGAQHLIDLGHRRFGIVSFMRHAGAPTLHPPAKGRPPEIAGRELDREKWAGYRDALEGAGISIDDVPVVQAIPWDQRAAAMMLDAAPDATAILSMSDLQGISVMGEARRRGLEVPRDLSVVGFNNIPQSRESDPPLTTVDGMGVAKGRAAARIVFEAGPPRHEVLPTELIVRGSTAAVRPRSLRQS